MINCNSREVMQWKYHKEINCEWKYGITSNFWEVTLSYSKKMGEFGGQNAHSTLNTDCESGV